MAVQGGATFFVDHSVAEEFLVGEVAVDVSGQLGVVVFAFFVEVAEEPRRDHHGRRGEQVIPWIAKKKNSQHW